MVMHKLLTSTLAAPDTLKAWQHQVLSRTLLLVAALGTVTVALSLPGALADGFLVVLVAQLLYLGAVFGLIAARRLPHGVRASLSLLPSPSPACSSWRCSGPREWDGSTCSF
jgi:hypothetical protein